ncbi:hypothetical protein J3P95_07285 [Pseudomonas sp. Z5-35]|uniref:hypothetical protein n=1 Tax=unclassified Pseudomonas TaxID=196821 RepID=UPI003DA8E3DD
MGFNFLLSKLLGLVSIVFVLAVQAATGPEVAHLLNNRYRYAPQQCPNNQPAYFCSGVLVSGLASGFTVKFWEHGPTADALGARDFSYLRRDLGIRTLTQPSGMVFSDSVTAISQGKSLDVLCAYPLVSTNRDKYGCGAGGSEGDPGSCAAQGVNDAPGWLAHFQQQDQQPAAQCSLSSRVAAQFRASLLAHEQLGGSWVAQPNQVQVRNWDPQAPTQVPVQALFYDVQGDKGLRVAQSDQNDYFAATGQWLPILRLDLAQPDGLVFGFDVQEQVYVGYQVAERLNRRYFDTAKTCPDGRASFYCNGIILRSTEAVTAFHAWDPSPRSEQINGVSASYARADAVMHLPAGPQGLLFKESSAPAAHPLTLRCLYPFDGYTGNLIEACTGRMVCATGGVDSVASWQGRYATAPYESCSFDTSADMAQVVMDIRNTVAHPQYNWNELVLAAWPKDIAEKLPIEAVYHGPGLRPGDGLAGARYTQDDYYQKTRRFWPVVQMRLNATDGQVFRFDPAEQCLTENCPPPPQAMGVQDMESWFREHGQ